MTLGIIMLANGLAILALLVLDIERMDRADAREEQRT